MHDRSARKDTGAPPPRRRDRQREHGAGSAARPGNQALRGLLQPHDDGTRLPAELRAQMESRFGHDFDDVRVHDGAKANSAADGIDAVAYTAGDHIVLGRDAPALDSAAGRTLLAHELNHVVQQREATHLVEGVSEPRDQAEVAAEAAAHHTGPVAAVLGGAVHAVQRQPVLGKERMLVKRERAEEILAEWLQQVMDAQGRRTIDKTPQVIDAITSLFKGDPVRQASVAQWLKGITDGTPKGLARQVAAKLPSEISEDRLEKIKAAPKMPGPPDDRPKSAGEAAAKTIVDSTVVPVVRGSGLPKDVQDKIISAARSAVAEGIIAILDQALDGAGVAGATKSAIHAAGQSAINQQAGTAMDRQQEGAGSPYRKEPPPSVAPAAPNVPGHVNLPPVPWDVPGSTTPRKPAAPMPKIDPAVEKAATTVNPKALVPDGVTGKQADVFGSAVDFALDVARRLDDAQAKKNTHLTIEMGAQYENVKDRAGVFQRAQAIVFAMRDALPHHAGLVERVTFTVQGKVVFAFSLHPSPR